jgi:hypothetical protein
MTVTLVLAPRPNDRMQATNPRPCFPRMAEFGARGFAADAWRWAACEVSPSPTLAAIPMKRLIPILVAASLAACSQRYHGLVSTDARESLRADVLGCYNLFTGRDQRVDSLSFFHASPRVQLDSTRLQFPVQDGIRVSRARLLFRLDTLGHNQDHGRQRHHFGPTWIADSLTNRIQLSFSYGFSGAYLVLSADPPAPDTLRGFIHEEWDVSPGPLFCRPKRAYVVRVPCTDDRNDADHAEASWQVRVGAAKQVAQPADAGDKPASTFSPFRRL